LDPVTLVTRSKLTQKRNNDRYYQNYLVPLAQKLPQHGFKASERALRSAFEWFDRRVEEHIKAVDVTNRGRALAQLIDSMSDKLFFTVITVSDELNAYKVFETLNARGVRLSATDLLKNYLFSVLHRSEEHEAELKALEDRWESLLNRLGAESLPDFLRNHWNSRHPSTRQTELFKVIRSRVTTRAQVFELLLDMDIDVETYVALTQPESPGWPAPWREMVGTLRMFSVRQPFPLLMAARRTLSDEAFQDVLASCVKISLRYNVIGGLHTSDQERAYHAAALGLATGKIRDARATLEVLRTVYVSDAQFEAAFADRSLRTAAARNRKLVRYLLSELERHVGGTAPDMDDPSVSIEHILPEHPSTGWDQFASEQLDDLVHRLGNMALLATSANRDLGNAEFAGKRDVYAKSAWKLTARLATDFPEWTPESIDRRQKQLARIATGVWRIDQLS
jgi:hypothetical protein